MFIDPLSALAAGIVFLIIAFIVVVLVVGVCYLALTTWLKTRHMKISDGKDEQK